MEILKRFELDLLTRGYSKRTIESYTGHVRYFLRNYKLDSDFDDYKLFLIHLREECKYTLSTISKYFASLSTFYDYLEYEKVISCNHVPKFRRRYLRNYKRLHTPETRKLLSIEEMKDLISQVNEPGYLAMMVLMAKTGIRRNELICLDKRDLDFDKNRILLKPAPKRSNRLIFFDDETSQVLNNYLASRIDTSQALIVGPQSNKRIYRNQVYEVVTRYAQKAGYHDPDGHLHQKFTPHCFRHWFTTHLRRAGMSREFLQELRGDSRRDAIDIYDHITPEELQFAYNKLVPKLGIL